MADERETFWNKLGDINAGMLGLSDDQRFMPMSHYPDPDASALWFISARGTDLVQSLGNGPQAGLHMVSDGGEGLYACIRGRLSLSDDDAKLEELWNAIASSWFEDGLKDPDIQLVRFDMESAEYWVTGGSMSFLYQIAKSKVSGEKPDLGDHGSLTF
ncbi:pyridoxamine 5'-phosphate oxidase family protein [Paracoccus tegillarcae]|uniref:General stress protein n=1 Tax=Paracoccus tegillarcae TaxID=1529068 RepID=A0A2K9ECM8_9RHOB|nr:pyridoxamine 5'-phosphate oxidase family protein [Paracoccus tegillarcae]AUH32039.1 general stress protein [Paracoccus tegillarcae]